MLKNRKGITLIALVVTILVLLILAGVTITTLMGDNGIINQTASAKDKTRRAAAEEVANLGYLNAQVDVHVKGTANGGLQGAVDALKAEKYTVKDANATSTSLSNVTLQDENGNNVGSSVKIATGTSTKTLTVKTETATTPGTGKPDWYVEINGLYHKLEEKSGRIEIKKDGKSESELGIVTTNSTITLAVTGLTGLVKVNGTAVTDSTEVKNNDTITIDSQSEATSGTITISAENIDDKEFNVAIANIKQATSVQIADKKGTANENKIYNLTINETNTKNMMINTGATNSVGLNANITSTGSGEDEEVIWSSANPEVLTVDDSGNLTGIADGTTTVSATTSVSGKTDQVEVTVTKFGEAVDYSVTVGSTTLSDWKIFYEENGNTFLIYGDYLPNSLFSRTITRNSQNTTIATLTGMTTAGNLRARWASVPMMQSVSNDILTLFKGTVYGLEDYNNSKCVSTLLNTSNWSDLLTSALTTKAGANNVKAVGSPTVEMWMESWNRVYPGDQVDYRKKPLDPNYSSVKPYGYQVEVKNGGSWDDYVYVDSKAGYKNALYYPRTAEVNDTNFSNQCWGYWLASPSAGDEDFVMRVDCVGDVGLNIYNDSHYSVRPVVCLPTSNLGSKDNTGKWTLDLN